MATLSPALLGNGRFIDVWRQILQRSPSPSIVIPAAVISIPSILSDIWGGILKAVPKKKTSHAKRRHRFMANNTLKDIKAVVQCPACGRPKRAHLLCPYCVADIKASWGGPLRALKVRTRKPATPGAPKPTTRKPATLGGAKATIKTQATQAIPPTEPKPESWLQYAKSFMPKSLQRATSKTKSVKSKSSSGSKR